MSAEVMSDFESRPSLSVSNTMNCVSIVSSALGAIQSRLAFANSRRARLPGEVGSANLSSAIGRTARLQLVQIVVGIALVSTP